MASKFTYSTPGLRRYISTAIRSRDIVFVIHTLIQQIHKKYNYNPDILPKQSAHSSVRTFKRNLPSFNDTIVLRKSMRLRVGCDVPIVLKKRRDKQMFFLFNV